MLEIHVFDEIIVADSLKKLIKVLIGVVQKWVQGDDNTPLNIVVKKDANKSPPALEINVKEEIITKTAFG